jgi:hypothetical protein
MGSYNGKVYRKQGGNEIVVESGGKITEESGGKILGRAVLNAYHADIGTSGSTFVTSPFAGTIVGLQAVNIAANAGTKSILTAKLTGGTITHPAWEVAVTAAAGTGTGVIVPTAANTVAAGDVIEIASDGGSSGVTPAMYSITILRTS